MDSPGRADFEELIARVATALAGQDLAFMLIGGQGVLVHGEPRLTQDVDVTLGASPDRLDDAIAACRAAELTPLPSDVAGFVRDTFVLPAADRATGVRVDLVFSSTTYEAEAIRRAVRIEVGGVEVPFASAEDLERTAMRWRRWTAAGTFLVVSERLRQGRRHRFEASPG